MLRVWVNKVLFSQFEDTSWQFDRLSGRYKSSGFQGGVCRNEDLTPRNVTGLSWHFGRTCCLHLQMERIWFWCRLNHKKCITPKDKLPSHFIVNFSIRTRILGVAFKQLLFSTNTESITEFVKVSFEIFSSFLSYLQFLRGINIILSHAVLTNHVKTLKFLRMCIH
jgi:hypothetical protein